MGEKGINPPRKNYGDRRALNDAGIECVTGRQVMNLMRFSLYCVVYCETCTVYHIHGQGATFEELKSTFM